jgi:hypothetical protein
VSRLSSEDHYIYANGWVIVAIVLSRIKVSVY